MSASALYRIVGGGTPTPQQLAALTVALTPVAAPEDDPAHQPVAQRGWADAAILEGVGHRPFVAHPDLEGGRFPLG